MCTNRHSSTGAEAAAAGRPPLASSSNSPYGRHHSRHASEDGDSSSTAGTSSKRNSATGSDLGSNSMRRRLDRLGFLNSSTGSNSGSSAPARPHAASESGMPVTRRGNAIMRLLSRKSGGSAR